MQQRKILLFAKTNGVLIGEIDGDSATSGLDLSAFDVKTVMMDEESGEYWYGDFATGEVKSREEKPLIHESVIKYQTNVRILEKYSLHKQLNLLIGMVDANLENKTPEWVEFKAFLDQVRDEYAQQVQVYKNNPDVYTFITEEEEKVDADKRSTLF